MYIDNFFDNCTDFRKYILDNRELIKDTTNPSDGLVYKNIMHPVHEKFVLEAHEKYKFICDFEIVPKMDFVRLSLHDNNPHHWAHIDVEIADYLAITYLNTDDQCEGGTALLEHHNGEIDFETMNRDSNDESKWNISKKYDMKFNRCMIEDANLIHASIPKQGFGTTIEDGRLVFISFFDKKEGIFIRPCRLSDMKVVEYHFGLFFDELKISQKGLKFFPTSWAQSMAHKIVNDPNFIFLIAKSSNGDLVSACGIEIGPSQLNFNQLVGVEKFWYVNKDYRNTRWGIKVKKAAEKACLDAGVNTIIFTSLQNSNDAVDRYYQKQGYQPLESHYIKEFK